MSEQKFIAYIRVSTKRQGQSGLGLEAQQATVADYVKDKGVLLKEYCEVESGKRSSNRPALNAALNHAKRSGAVLVVAKLDRLSRNVAFLSTLMESGVEFVACDNPHATRFTIHILAAVAEWERETISKRTREALQVAKARGVKLGSHRPGHWDEDKNARRLAALERGRAKAAETNRARVIRDYDDLLPVMRELRQAGKSFAQVASVLNAEGHCTRRKLPFSATTVKRILDRATVSR